MGKTLNKYLDRKIINDAIQIDVEFGNENTFFSGKKHIELYQTSLDFDASVLSSFEADIDGAKGRVTDRLEKVDDNAWHRELTFNTHAESHLFDFVSRFVVKTKSPIAYINDVMVKHKCSNVYHQFLSTDMVVEVPIDEDHKLVFRELSASQEKYFNNVFYLRDESVENGTYKWIVHHRKIVKIEHAKLILRGCNPKIEGVIPFQQFIPNFLKKPLFRIRESKYPSFPIMAVGIYNVNVSNLKLTTEIRLVNA
ncbi:hypothetical protein ACK32R_09740 [Aeromonas dhakensis]